MTTSWRRFGQSWSFGPDSEHPPIAAVGQQIKRPFGPLLYVADTLPQLAEVSVFDLGETVTGSCGVQLFPKKVAGDRAQIGRQERFGE